jgi:hypothetical protein
MMNHSDERRAVVNAVFAATGKKVDEDDPIIVAALFQAHTMREVVREATGQIAEAGLMVKRAADDAHRAVVASEAASRSAASVLERMSGDRTQLVKAVETQMVKCVKLVSKGQSGVQGFSDIPFWYAIGGAFAGAVVITISLMSGFERGSAQATEAAVGRSFSRVVPELDPKVREHLLEHLRKKGG